MVSCTVFRAFTSSAWCLGVIHPAFGKNELIQTEPQQSISGVLEPNEIVSQVGYLLFASLHTLSGTEIFRRVVFLYKVLLEDTDVDAEVEEQTSQR
jgi:hypothetical protein